jgi:hypothetical protein
MKISELIARLAEMLEEHGDVSVITYDGRGNYVPIKEIRSNEDDAVIIG